MAALQLRMGREGPRGHFAEVERPVENLIDETALALGQLGDDQVGQRLQVGVVAVLHDLAVARAFEFEVVRGTDHLPLEVEALFAAADQHFAILAREGIPCLAIGIGGIRHPFATGDQRGAHPVAIGRMLQQIAFFGPRDKNAAGEQKRQKEVFHAIRFLRSYKKTGSFRAFARKLPTLSIHGLSVTVPRRRRC